MFEKYTPAARKAIFNARYEASQFGTPEVLPEYLLLGGL
jgi:ATP-dependent Clp protease ATP-binding subunit ClpC